MTLDPVADTAPCTHYELRYPALGRGCGFAFPCDAKGQVALDALSERALANYLYARAVVGRELATPRVVVKD